MCCLEQRLDDRFLLPEVGSISQGRFNGCTGIGMRKIDEVFKVYIIERVSGID